MSPSPQRKTLGYHIVLSGYGLWLPGDQRGSWSEAWDEQIGYIEPHQLHGGDPVRQQMARERMAHAPVRFSHDMSYVMIDVINNCQRQSAWDVAAAAIEPTHLHLLMTYAALDIDRTIKWLKQQITKAIHQRTDHHGPVWAKYSWRSFIYDQDHWEQVKRYINRHNDRAGRDSTTYPFVRGDL